MKIKKEEIFVSIILGSLAYLIVSNSSKKNKTTSSSVKGILNSDKYNQFSSDSLGNAIKLEPLAFGPYVWKGPSGMPIDIYFNEICNLCSKYNIVFCLENNSSLYGCNWMTTINETIQFVKKINHSHLKVNLDIGSIIMENEYYQIKLEDIPYIGHVQVSFPNLDVWNSKYEDIIKKIINDLHKYNYKGKISLEMKPSNSLPFQSIDSFINLMNN